MQLRAGLGTPRRGRQLAKRTPPAARHTPPDRDLPWGRTAPLSLLGILTAATFLAAPPSAAQPTPSPAPTVSLELVAPDRVKEGEEWTITVKVKGSITQPLTFDYEVEPGSGTTPAQPGDFGIPGSKVGLTVFPKGSGSVDPASPVVDGARSTSFQLMIFDDGFGERKEETFTITVENVRVGGSPVNPAITRSHPVTIATSDNTHIIWDPTLSVTEGKTALQTVWLSGDDPPPPGGAVLDWITKRTEDANTADEGDFDNRAFPTSAGRTPLRFREAGTDVRLRQSFGIKPRDDKDVEGDETFTIVVSSEEVDGRGRKIKTATILDNDAEFSLVPSEQTVSEGGVASFTVTVTGAFTADVQFDYEVVRASGPGKAVAGDFGTSVPATKLPGEEMIPIPISAPASPGPVAKGSYKHTFSLPILDDPFNEPKETFTVTVSNFTGGGRKFTFLSGSATAPDSASATVTIPISDPTTVALSAPAEVTEGKTVPPYKLSLAGGIFTQEIKIEWRVSRIPGVIVPPVRALREDFSDGTADDGPATQFPRGSVTFAPPTADPTTGEPKLPTPKTFEIAIRDDDEIEPDEAFRVIATIVSGPVTAADRNLRADTRIVDNDIEISISALAAAVAEGGTAEFEVTVTGFITQAVTFEYEVEVGSGTGLAELADFGGTTPATSLPMGPGRITPRAAGSTDPQTFPIRVPIRQDGIAEPAETFTVKLKKVDGGGSGINLITVTPSATATIEASDPISISVEGPPGEVPERKGSVAVFTVTATGTTTAKITGLTYTLVPGTADAGDYDAAGATPALVEIPSGKDQTATITVPIEDDDEPEGAETFTLTLNVGTAMGADGATLNVDPSAATATATIAGSDRTSMTLQQVVSETDPTPTTEVGEGATATYRVTLSGDTPTEPFVVLWSAEPAAANSAEGADFARGGFPRAVLTFSFPAGGASTLPVGDAAPTKTFQIATVRDDGVEGAEKFVVRARPRGSPAAAGATVTTTLRDADAEITITPPTQTVSEGDEAVFTVRREGELGREIQVPYRVHPGLPSNEIGEVGRYGSADSGDYSDPAGGTVTIGAGERTAEIVLPIVADGEAEGAEALTVILETPRVSGGGSPPSLAKPFAATAIIAASQSTQLTLSGPTEVTEGETATYTATLGGDVPTQQIKVAWRVERPSEGDRGLVPADFGDGTATELPSGSVIFSPPSGGTFEIPTRQNAAIEEDKPFIVTADLQLVPDRPGSTATVNTTLRDDDARIGIAAKTETVVEGDFAAFLVTVEGTTTEPVTVTYTVAGGPVPSPDVRRAAARDLGEYPDNRRRLSSFPQDVALTVPAGTDRRAVIALPIFDDAEAEGEEPLTVTLSGPQGGGAGIELHSGALSATATIARSDNLVLTQVVSKTDLRKVETVSEPGTATYRVVGDPSATPLVVRWEVEDVAGAADSATAADFPGATFPDGELTLPADSPEDFFSFEIAEDDIAEGAEPFQVTATPANRPLPALRATVKTTIVANDGVVISVENAAAVEEGEEAVFTVTATGTTTAKITGLTYTLVAGTAGASDYVTPEASARAFEIPAGTNPTAKIRVKTVDDALAETAETFTLTLGGTLAGGGARVRPALSPAPGATSATATIAASDPISISVEGPEEEVAERSVAVFTVTATGTTTDTVMVRYDVREAATGSSAQAADLGNADNTLPLSAFPTDQTVTIRAGKNRSAAIELPIYDDPDAEGAESFTVTLNVGSATGANGATLNVDPTAATATIVGSDRTSMTLQQVVSETDPTPTTEVEEKATATYRVKLSGDTPTQPVVVSWSVAGGRDSTKADKDDFAAGSFPKSSASNALRFTALGDQFFSFAIKDDTDVEGVETFQVTATTPALDVLAANRTVTAKTSILDNDATLAIAPSTQTVHERGAASFTVTLTGAFSADVKFDYEVEKASGSGKADAGDFGDEMDGMATDFPGETRTISVTAPGSSGSRAVSSLIDTFDVPIFDDALGEGPETFTVIVSNPSGGGRSFTFEPRTDRATATIAGSDRTSMTLQQVVSETDPTPTTEVEEKATATYRVKLSGDTPTQPVVVSWSVAGGRDSTKADKDDFAAGSFPKSSASNALRFTALGDQFFSFAIKDDTDVEGVETFQVTATTPALDVLAANRTVTAKTSILDNDATLAIAPSTQTVHERGAASFTVTLTGAFSADVKFDYEVEKASGSGKADAGDFGDEMDGMATDFPGETRTISVTAPGSSGSRAVSSLIDTFDVPIFDDALGEGPETFTVIVSNPSGGGRSFTFEPRTDRATATIAGSDRTSMTLQQVVSETDPTPTTEVEEKATATYRVKLSGDTPTQPVVVSWSVAGGRDSTEADKDDFAAGSFPKSSASNALRFTALGDQFFSFAIKDDTDVEGVETFQVTATTPALDVLAANRTVTAKTSILDNDATLAIAPSTQTVHERGAASFTVTLTGAFSADVKFDYEVEKASGSGKADAGDFGDEMDGMATDFPGETRTISVTAPGSSGSRAVSSLIDTFDVPIFDDALGEGPETFTVIVSNPSGGGRSFTFEPRTDRATATIAGSDRTSMTLQQVVSETDPTPTTEVEEKATATYRVTLGGDTPTQSVVVSWSVAGGRDSTEADKDDFAAGSFPKSSASNALRFTALGDQFFSFAIKDDTDVEGVETFQVTATTPALDVLAANRTVTAKTSILDNDATLAIAPSTQTVHERGAASFTVTLTGAFSADVKFDYEVEKASGSGKADAGDFGDEMDGMATDFPGETRTISVTAPGSSGSRAVSSLIDTFDVPIFDDALGEGPETFTVIVSNPSGGGRSFTFEPRTDRATATIAGSDRTSMTLQQVVSETDPTPTTEVEEKATATYRVGWTGDAPDGPLAIRWHVGESPAAGSSSATAADFKENAFPHNALGPELTLSAADREAFFSFPVLDDDLAEGEELFRVTATATPSNHRLPTPPTTLRATATTKIAASDAVPVSVELSGPKETTEGSTEEYTVAVTGTTTDRVTVRYSVVGATAEAAEAADLGDATNTAGLADFPTDVVVTIPAGMNPSKKFSLRIFNDLLAEEAESFTVSLQSVSGGGALVEPSPGAKKSVTTEIAASDGVPISVAQAAAVEEGEEAVFTVTATGTTTAPITGLTYTLVAGTAGASDYVTPEASARAFEIPAGTNPTAEIRVMTVDDELSESQETFTLQLGGTPSDGGTGVPPQIETASATGTIDDNDALVWIRGPKRNRYPEGTTAIFRFERLERLENEMEVQYTVSGVDPSDYRDPSKGRIAMGAGKSGVELPIAILNDGVDEDIERLTVEITSARLGGTGSGSAVPDPTRRSASIEIAAPLRVTASLKGPEEVREGDAARYEVSLTVEPPDFATVDEVVVGYRVGGSGSGDTAERDVDYTVPSGEELRFAPGVVSGKFQIAVLRDALIEGVETMTVALETARSSAGAAVFQVGTEWRVPTRIVDATDEERREQRTRALLAATNRAAAEMATDVISRRFHRGPSLPDDPCARGSDPTRTRPEFCPPPEPSSSRQAPTAGPRAHGKRLPTGERAQRGLSEAKPERSSSSPTSRPVGSEDLGHPAQVLPGAAGGERSGARTEPIQRDVNAQHGLPRAALERPAAGTPTDRAIGGSVVGAALRIAAEHAPAAVAEAQDGCATSGAPAGAPSSAAGDRAIGGNAIGAAMRIAAASGAGAEQSCESALPRAPGGSPRAALPKREPIAEFVTRAELTERAANAQHAPSSAQRQPSAGSTPGTETTTTTTGANAIGTVLRLSGLSGALSAGSEAHETADPQRAALLAGIETPAGRVETGPAQGAYGTGSRARGREFALRLPSFRELLQGVDFELRAEELGWERLGEGLAIWGHGAVTRLEGDPVLAGQRLDYEGESYGVFVGADQRLEVGAAGSGHELVAGAALGWTRGDLDFTDRARQGLTTTGRFESELISLHPYASLSLSRRARLWLLAGYGWGDVEITEREGADGDGARRRVETDAWLWMVSAGVESSLPVPGLGDASEVLLRVWGTRTGGSLERARFDTGALLRGTHARTWGFAGEVEASHRIAFGEGAYFRPFVTGRLRGEAGDDLGDDWELGVDVGGGAELAWSELGLSLELRGTAQLNEGAGRREHRVSADLSYDLGGDGRGVTASLESSLEGSGRLGDRGRERGFAGGAFGAALPGTEELIAREASELGEGSLRPRVVGEIGYGLVARPLAWTRGLLTPYARLEWGAGRRGYAAGLRFESAGGTRLGMEAVADFLRGGADSAAGISPDYQFLLTGELTF